MNRAAVVLLVGFENVNSSRASGGKNVAVFQERVEAAGVDGAFV